ncbi:uncharacterized protein Z518_10911 [Rhinocladiella mackenziei CBS 650.93]|uniref:Transcription initiation factor TFIID subunit 10 n=1 Tax=Rhinocladiella mackenziei CBS 650.93 TaxID=1442369 RepID=A0A0D2I2M7_9EURO|nr:uncharacterized protein Z518_10911 [Rhinocladiella mackenziei CBS 650.93]KIW99983.1 hypothetical protein Z518_10911 [Rhinocladiella mackenziei CBS 650.93]
MSSPPSMSEQGHPAMKDVDVDTEMEDTQDNTTTSATRNPNEGASRTPDHDFTQSETQPATASGLPHHNRKDVTLREFLSKMDDYAPIIPDAVTAHYLTLSGLPPPSPADPTGASTNTTPLPLARLLALATQKFVADIAADAYQYSRIRSSNSASASNPLGSTAMGMGGGPSGAAGAGAGVGGGTGKSQQSTQLGVQRSGYGGGGQGGSGQGRTVLTMEDLGMAVQEYGVNIKRGEFYR